MNNNLIIKNARIITPLGTSALKGKEMNQLLAVSYTHLTLPTILLV